MASKRNQNIPIVVLALPAIQPKPKRQERQVADKDTSAVDNNISKHRSSSVSSGKGRKRKVDSREETPGKAREGKGRKGKAAPKDNTTAEKSHPGKGRKQGKTAPVDVAAAKGRPGKGMMQGKATPVDAAAAAKEHPGFAEKDDVNNDHMQEEEMGTVQQHKISSGKEQIAEETAGVQQQDLANNGAEKVVEEPTDNGEEKNMEVPEGIQQQQQLANGAQELPQQQNDADDIWSYALMNDIMDLP